MRERGLALSARRVRRYPRGMRPRRRRTASSVRHERDPAEAERAGVALGHLMDRAESGMVESLYLDECGSAPSPPTGCSRRLPGQREFVRYEYPRGRRVGVMATYSPLGPAPRLAAAAFERTLASAGLLECLRAPPASRVPWVVAPDDAGMHAGKAVKAARKELAGRGAYPYYLPAYGPESNRIGPVFEQIKHHEIPRRSHKSKAELRSSVESGFEPYGRKLDPKSGKELRPAA